MIKKIYFVLSVILLTFVIASCQYHNSYKCIDTPSFNGEAEIDSSVYQWAISVKEIISPETQENPTAFLWIPEDCEQVRGVIIGQHNMSEEDLFDRAKFREEMTKLDIAIVWITPAIDMVFNFHEGTGGMFERILKSFADVSGYSELEFAPVIPIGHSAAASYPWNFGAWKPERTLAMISLHGDAPLTNLTGSGRPNPDWEERTIDGIPGLMIEGEYEWWEDRVQPALDYKKQHPMAPVSFLCDAGHGHFDVSDMLVDYINMFIRKVVYYRLAEKYKHDESVQLNPINPEEGWLKERWRKGETPSIKAAPYKEYTGNKSDAFWYFDKEMADATENYYNRSRTRKDQYLGFLQGGKLLPFNEKSHARIQAKFLPEDDGITFFLKTSFTDSARQVINPEHGQGNPVINRICGPVKRINDSTFTICFYRMGFNNPKRTGDIWLLASHPGNDEFKSTVQQLNLRIPYRLEEGTKQVISFPFIKDQQYGVESITLDAKCSSGLPVYYYVKAGPAKVMGNKLIFTKVPPRSKYPIKVTVVAWQYGSSYAPKYQTAESVEMEFFITEN